MIPSSIKTKGISDLSFFLDVDTGSHFSNEVRTS